MFSSSTALVFRNLSDVAQDPSGSNGWMAGEHHLFDGREDAHSGCGSGALRRKDKRRLRQVCLARDLLHRSVVEAGRVVKDG
jgi:hypothetical protein